MVVFERAASVPAGISDQMSTWGWVLLISCIVEEERGLLLAVIGYTHVRGNRPIRLQATITYESIY